MPGGFGNNNNNNNNNNSNRPNGCGFRRPRSPSSSQSDSEDPFRGYTGSVYNTQRAHRLSNGVVQRIAAAAAAYIRQNPTLTGALDTIAREELEAQMVSMVDRGLAVNRLNNDFFGVRMSEHFSFFLVDTILARRGSLRTEANTPVAPRWIEESAIVLRSRLHEMARTRLINPVAGADYPSVAVAHHFVTDFWNTISGSNARRQREYHRRLRAELNSLRNTQASANSVLAMLQRSSPQVALVASQASREPIPATLQQQLVSVPRETLPPANSARSPLVSGPVPYYELMGSSSTQPAARSLNIYSATATRADTDYVDRLIGLADDELVPEAPSQPEKTGKKKTSKK